MGALAAGCASAVAGDLSEFKLLRLDGGPVKWGTGELGTRALVTYALVPVAMAFEGARNCAAVAPVDQLLRANRIAPSAFEREVAAAFAAWSTVADIDFAVAEAADADILIGAQAQPRGRAFTNVAHTPSPDPTDVGAILKSVICLNPATGWKVGFDGDLEVYDVRYTLTHEIGHAIGLDHPGVPGELMDFRYRETFAAPQPGDRAGAVSLYGPRLESARVPAAPTRDDGSGAAVAERGFGMETHTGRVSAEGN